MIGFMVTRSTSGFEKTTSGWYSTASWMFSEPRFAQKVNLIENMPFEPLRPYSVKDQLQHFIRILQTARSAKLLHLFSTVGKLKPELLAAACLALLPKSMRPAVVIQGPMWEPDSGIKGVFEKILLKILRHSVDRFAVYSKEEIPVFSTTWGIPSHQVDAIPYCFNPKIKIDTPEKQQKSQYVFAGGNSHRNYLPLVEAARMMPDVQFFIASHRLSGLSGLPANVQASSLPHDVYTKTMENAAVNIVPIQNGLHRSVGHQTFLNSMVMKIPTVVNRVLGIEEYIDHEQTGWLVDGSPESYAEAVRSILAPENKTRVNEICENAAAVVREKFSLGREAATLLEWFEILTDRKD